MVSPRGLAAHTMLTNKIDAAALAVTSKAYVGNLLGMFELNNADMTVQSPLQAYLEAARQLASMARSVSMGVSRCAVLFEPRLRPTSNPLADPHNRASLWASEIHGTPEWLARIDAALLADDAGCCDDEDGEAMYVLVQLTLVHFDGLWRRTVVPVLVMVFV